MNSLKSGNNLKDTHYNVYLCFFKKKQLKVYEELGKKGDGLINVNKRNKNHDVWMILNISTFLANSMNQDLKRWGWG